MITQVYRLVAPKRVEICFKEVAVKENDVVIKPAYLSICHADQRYYQGLRSKEILAQKLPMAMIHEAVGTVLSDKSGEFKKGDKVVMIPNTPTETDEVIAENYLRSSKFRSSGYDGFMQEIIAMPKDRLVKLPDSVNIEIASFTELISVAMHAIGRFEERAHKRRDVLGVWGDGNLGFLSSLILRHKYPNAKLYIFGKNRDKLDYFTFADKTFEVDNIPSDLRVDHAFEAVGGIGSQYAINQIIDFIHPQGVIGLLGVSEDPVAINTRMVLEKGLNLVGSSRSGRVDFQQAVDFISNKEISELLESLVSSFTTVNDISDIEGAFESDRSSTWGKTVMKWSI